MSQAIVQEMPATRATPAKKFAAPRKRFHELAPHLPAIVLDAEGSIQHLTPAARRMLEYRLEQPIDPCFFAHVHGRNLYQVMRDIADMVCYGKAQATWLLRIRTGQNRWHWFKAVAQNRLDEPEATITITLRDPQTA